MEIPAIKTNLNPITFVRIAESPHVNIIIPNVIAPVSKYLVPNSNLFLFHSLAVLKR